MAKETLNLSLLDPAISFRGYQKFGAEFMVKRKRIILGDDMGLGKTLQAIAAFITVYSNRCDNSNLTDTKSNYGETRPRILIIAPAGLLINWEKEIQKFLIDSRDCRSISTRLMHGGKENVMWNFAAWIKKGGIAITSFSSFRANQLGGLIEIMIGASDKGSAYGKGGNLVDYVVIDEAHLIKNPNSGRTKEVRKALQYSENAVLMSGTPMENNPGEFVELIRAIDPERADKVDMNLNRRYFAEDVADMYLRRNQEDVLKELPEKIEIDQWVSATDNDLGNYMEHVMCRNFMGMRRSSGAEAKLVRLRELLDCSSEGEHGGDVGKTIIFSFFHITLDNIAGMFNLLESGKYLGDEDIQSRVIGKISGKIDARQKQQLVDDFNASDDPNAILLLQINAGGVGLNIQGADNVVIMEPQIKPTLETQAIARCYRMGRDNTKRVIVHRLMTTGNCDEVMFGMLRRKTRLFDDFVRDSISCNDGGLAAIDSSFGDNTNSGYVGKTISGEDVIMLEQKRMGLWTEDSSSDGMGLKGNDSNGFKVDLDSLGGW